MTVEQKKELKQRNRNTKKSRRRKRKRILLALEFLVLIVLAVLGFVAAKYGMVEVIPIIETNIIINEDVEENLKEYTNIALFGIDSRNESLGQGNHSDTIMVASINNKTKEVRLISVYRDTYLLIPEEGESFYNKANLGYFYGGPELAINELNLNLDLDITDYVSVNFSALIDTIDALGGIDIEITADEMFYINGYMTETSEITGKEKIELTESGLVHLNGMQATSYCRIRFVPTINGTHDDYGRTERQRIVLGKIAEKARKADLVTLNQTVDAVLPNVSTSLTPDDILSLLKGITKYELVGNIGFPFEKEGADMGYKGSCVVPADLTYNVMELHHFLFGVEGYQVSNAVENISIQIVEDSGVAAVVKEDIE